MSTSAGSGTCSSTSSRTPRGFRRRAARSRSAPPRLPRDSCASLSTTAAGPSPPRPSRACSSASTGCPASPSRGPASAWRSPARSSSPTAGASPARAPPAQGRNFTSWCPPAEGRAGALLVAPVPDDVVGDVEPEDAGDQVADDAEGGIPEQGGVHAGGDEQRRADDERAHDQAERDPVGVRVGGLLLVLEPLVLEIDGQFVVLETPHEPGQLRGKVAKAVQAVLGELLHPVDDGLCAPVLALHLLQGRTRVLPYVEVGVERPAHLLYREHR